MIVIVIFLIVIVLGMSVRYYYLKREMRDIAETIHTLLRQPSKEYDAHKDQCNARINTSSQDRDITALANAVNLLFDDRYEDRIENERFRRDFHKNMENISHDLRTPLTSVIGYINLLSKIDDLPVTAKRYISVSATKANLLKQLVDNLFELTHLEAYQFPFKIEALDINTLLSEEIAGFYDSLMKQPSPPDIRLCDTTPLLIQADRAAVSRIFVNLLENVFKHNGTNITITSGLHDNNALVLISNKAQDITAAQAENIFDRFYVADRTRCSQNNGLGLSIVRELAEQMHGSIRCEFNNEILTFIIELPLYKKND